MSCLQILPANAWWCIAITYLSESIFYGKSSIPVSMPTRSLSKFVKVLNWTRRSVEVKVYSLTIALQIVSLCLELFTFKLQWKILTIVLKLSHIQDWILKFPLDRKGRNICWSFLSMRRGVNASQENNARGSSMTNFLVMPLLRTHHKYL